MSFTSDGNSSDNDIYSVDTSSYTWQAKMWPTTQTISGKTYLSKVSITPNIYYSYAVGAISNHYDIQSIMTHETGHALGIAHCHEAGETHGTDDHKNAVYQYVPNNTTDARTLKSYDTASKQNLYWNAH